MTILINGLGNIGTTLLNALIRFKNELNIEKIYVIKNFPKTWEEFRYRSIIDMGVEIISFNDLAEIEDDIDFVFDTTSNGVGEKNKIRYSSFKNLTGAVAQGSEEDFGIPYMAGINDSVIKDEKFITVVSCNTHGILSLLDYYSNGDFNDIDSADFVIVRRSEDLGNHERLVSANVIARNRSDFGTHHGTDADRVLQTIGKSIDIFSSDITTPSQLMHGLRFNIELKGNPKAKTKNMLSFTEYFDSNRIFEIGRREGFQGRLYSHGIVVSNNIISRNNRVIGWAFIPQEGNTILSTIKAYLIKTEPEQYEELFSKIADQLIIKYI